MSNAVSVTFERTLGFSRSLYTTVIAFAGFLAASSALFLFSVDAAEGSAATLASLWAAGASPFLPVLAALYGMETWSGERRSGRIETLLASPVRERDMVVGKFLGVWAMMVFSIVVFHVSSAVAVSWFAPKLMAGQGMFSFLPAFAGLALQSALWSAVAVMMSSFTRSSALAACLSIALTVALPRGLWWVARQWSGEGKSAFGEMPLDANAFDFASGLFSTADVFCYVAFSASALFIATKSIVSLRFSGKGTLGWKYSNMIAVMLSIVLAVTSASLASRLDFTIDIPVGRSAQWGRDRTRKILSETRGRIDVTLLLSRKDSMFRPLAHSLRALSGLADSAGGARLAVRYVDPVWDVGPAERLVREGVEGPGIVFSKGRRMEVLPISGGLDDRAVASAIRKVALPPQRRTICWVAGHGESSFESYGSFGMSDIARDLVREGYRNQTLELTSDSQIPQDAALVIVAGAKNGFASIETGRLEAYLHQGGRLLVLIDSTDSVSLVSLLSAWGIMPLQASLPGAKTLSGTDVIVDGFGDHPITDPLKRSQLVFEKPLQFVPSAVAESLSAGADGIEFTELAKVGSATVAAISERGAGLGEDLARAIRPTRVAAIGDATFVMNAHLSSRANANRDFFLNAVAYLAGTGGTVGPGEHSFALVSGIDRATRLRFAASYVVGVPLLLALVMCVFVSLRRR